MDQDDTSANDLFVEFQRTRDRALRNQLVERHTGLAVHIANRHATGAAQMMTYVRSHCWPWFALSIASIRTAACRSVRSPGGRSRAS